MKPWVVGSTVLLDRMRAPGQSPPEVPAGGLPPYLATFLARVRLLVGVPFEYLVPDAGLLPPESIRFFHVDRSWTDRLVDGALAVGKVGTREQAHHHAHADGILRSLDRAERQVRAVQRRQVPFDQARIAAEQDPEPAGIVTGLLLRSMAVSEHPDLEVRATLDGAGLRTLRLERLADTVLIALFDGIPDRVTLEEPHRGVPFGVDGAGLPVRDATGRPVSGARPVAVPFRSGGKRVLDVRELRSRLAAAGSPQSGSAAFALAVLAPPWRQVFAGSGGAGPGPVRQVAEWVADDRVLAALEEVVP